MASVSTPGSTPNVVIAINVVYGLGDVKRMMLKT